MISVNSVIMYVHMMSQLGRVWSVRLPLNSSSWWVELQMKVSALKVDTFGVQHMLSFDNKIINITWAQTQILNMRVALAIFGVKMNGLWIFEVKVRWFMIFFSIYVHFKLGYVRVFFRPHLKILGAMIILAQLKACFRVPTKLVKITKWQNFDSTRRTQIFY